MNSMEYEAVIKRLNEHQAAIAATTLALSAATSLLRKEQLDQLMERIARDSAEKQAFVEQQQTPQQAEKVTLLQAAEQRIFLAIQLGWAAHNPKT